MNDLLGRKACLGAVLAAAVIAGPAAAQARPAVAVDSAVFVERAAASGRQLEPAQRLSRGDRVVTIVTWQRTAGSGAFTVINPLPPSVYYQGSSLDEGEAVSVDGGRTWGTLDTLRVGGRSATPEDVTHVRWRVAAAEAARGSGRIAYSAIVR